MSKEEQSTETIKEYVVPPTLAMKILGKLPKKIKKKIPQKKTKEDIPQQSKEDILEQQIITLEIDEIAQKEVDIEKMNFVLSSIKREKDITKKSLLLEQYNITDIVEFEKNIKENEDQLFDSLKEIYYYNLLNKKKRKTKVEKANFIRLQKLILEKYKNVNKDFFIRNVKLYGELQRKREKEFLELQQTREKIGSTQILFYNLVDRLTPSIYFILQRKYNKVIDIKAYTREPLTKEISIDELLSQDITSNNKYIYNYGIEFFLLRYLNIFNEKVSDNIEKIVDVSKLGKKDITRGIELNIINDYYASLLTIIDKLSNIYRLQLSIQENSSDFKVKELMILMLKFIHTKYSFIVGDNILNKMQQSSNDKSKFELRYMEKLGILQQSQSYREGNFFYSNMADKMIEVYNFDKFKRENNPKSFYVQAQIDPRLIDEYNRYTKNLLGKIHIIEIKIDNEILSKMTKIEISQYISSKMKEAKIFQYITILDIGKIYIIKIDNEIVLSQMKIILFQMKKVFSDRQLTISQYVAILDKIYENDRYLGNIITPKKFILENINKIVTNEKLNINYLKKYFELPDSKIYEKYIKIKNILEPKELKETKELKEPKQLKGPKKLKEPKVKEPKTKEPKVKTKEPKRPKIRTTKTREISPSTKLMELFSEKEGVLEAEQFYNKELYEKYSNELLLLLENTTSADIINNITILQIYRDKNLQRFVTYMIILTDLLLMFKVDKLTITYEDINDYKKTLFYPSSPFSVYVKILSNDHLFEQFNIDITKRIKILKENPKYKDVVSIFRQILYEKKQPSKLSPEKEVVVEEELVEGELMEGELIEEELIEGELIEEEQIEELAEEEGEEPKGVVKIFDLENSEHHYLAYKSGEGGYKRLDIPQTELAKLQIELNSINIQLKSLGLLTSDKVEQLLKRKKQLLLDIESQRKVRESKVPIFTTELYKQESLIQEIVKKYEETLKQFFNDKDDDLRYSSVYLYKVLRSTNNIKTFQELRQIILTGIANFLKNDSPNLVFLPVNKIVLIYDDAITAFFQEILQQQSSINFQSLIKDDMDIQLRQYIKVLERKVVEVPKVVRFKVEGPKEVVPQVELEKEEYSSLVIEKFKLFTKKLEDEEILTVLNFLYILYFVKINTDTNRELVLRFLTSFENEKVIEIVRNISRNIKKYELQEVKNILEMILFINNPGRRVITRPSYIPI